jgi:hypothetical protein
MTAFTSTEQRFADNIEAEAQRARATSILGERDKGLAVSEVAGVIGGLLGGACALSAGHSKGAAIGGAIAGAIGGYALGTVMSPFSNVNTTTKVLTGITAGSFGVSVASLGAAIIDSLGNLGGQA